MSELLTLGTSQLMAAFPWADVEIQALVWVIADRHFLLFDGKNDKMLIYNGTLMLLKVSF